MSSKKDSYHHGALREALLEAAEKIVRREGVNALTLRAVARAAGVSHAAPAHHFKDAKGLLTHALRSDDPVMFLEHRELLTVKGPVPEGDYEIPFGQARVLRTGQDVTVVALALMAQHTLKAAETLAGEGISVEVIDPRTIAPLDIDTVLASVAKTGRLLIVDEAFSPFGVGAEIAADGEVLTRGPHVMKGYWNNAQATAEAPDSSKEMEELRTALVPNQRRVMAAA